MFERPIQSRLAFLLILLMGLVGAWGDSLHGLFDCCHHCRGVAEAGGAVHVPVEATNTAQCGCCHDGHADRFSRSPSGPVGDALTKSNAGCAICQLLYHFHSTVMAADWQLRDYLDPNGIALAMPTLLGNASIRLAAARGPPANSHECCA